MNYSDDQYLRSRESSKIAKFLRMMREKMVIRHLDLFEPKSILEIGAADCRLAKFIADTYPNINVVAMDRSSQMLNRLPQGREQRIVGAASDLPFENNRFDFVYLVSTMKHIFFLKKALDEIGRVLAQGGHVLVVEPSYWIIRIGAKLGKFDLNSIPNLWTLKETSEILNNAGFVTKNKGYFDLIPGTKSFSNWLIRFFNAIRLNKVTLYQYILVQKYNHGLREHKWIKNA